MTAVYTPALVAALSVAVGQVYKFPYTFEGKTESVQLVVTDVSDTHIYYMWHDDPQEVNGHQIEYQMIRETWNINANGRIYVKTVDMPAE